MTEGGIADRELAALALKQASGDNVEAIFLLRAYRTTLAKLAVSEPLDTTEMRPAGKRRSADADHSRQRTTAVAARFQPAGASGAGEV
ncbi:PhnI protein [Klebsiella pneumoniae]|nr:PhnI protein [Klebsiella pneumoniae]